MAKENISLNVPQAADDFKMLFPIPWDHHRRIIDKCKGDMDKALFFVRKTWENNWGRDALLNWLIPTFMSVTAKQRHRAQPRDDVPPLELVPFGRQPERVHHRGIHHHRE